MRAAFSIELAPTAIGSLRAVRDKKIRAEIASAIDGLGTEPQQQGNELTGELAGLRSIHAFRDRYRVLFDVDAAEMRVRVFLVGERRPGRPSDVYREAALLLKQLLE